MQIIPPERFPERDAAGFIQFLEYCRAQARIKGKAQLASVCLKVKHIDPLAVLESIYEPDQLHFYLEQPQANVALAGAEAVVSLTAEGADRFAKLKKFTEEITGNTIVIGDVDRSQLGPKFFCAFTFEDDNFSGETGFPPAMAFVPRWQVERHADQHFAVANAMIDVNSELEPLARRILGAHEKFSGFDYTDVDPGMVPKVESTTTVNVNYKNSVADALKAIEAGDYQKIVLSQAIDVVSDAPFLPLQTLHRLRERFPACHCFSVNNGTGQSFIGATPERLVRLTGDALETEAIAGSIKRGNGAREDAQLGSVLLSSDKDLREHRHVIECLCQRLKALGVDVKTASAPGLIKLQNVQHMRTPVWAQVDQCIHLLDVAKALHPTPAVGGRPRESAIAKISAMEGYARGLFAGLIGWFDAEGRGELTVGIRSGLFNGKRARLFAGAGIVAGSDPAREQAETELKLRALLDAIQ